MPKKKAVSKTTAETSQVSKESDIEKSPTSRITSPPSKLSSIKKYLKSPRQDEKSKKTQTKKSTKTGKSKNIESYVEDSPNVSGNKVGSSKTIVGDESVMGNTTFEKDLEQEGQISRSEAGDHSSPGLAGKDIHSSLDVIENISSSSGQTRSEDSGKRTMVQTSLSMGKDGIEVLSSPEQKTEKKQRKKASSKKNESEKKQTRITNIFPSRKSSRKSKSQQEKDEQARITKAILSQTFEGLEVRKIEGKGRGVFANRDFKRNEFVCEYSGELINYDEAKKREIQYGEDTNIGCYMYYLTCNNKKYCIDATAEDGTLGRLLNHSRSGNCKTKVHVINNQPHLIFLTTKDVKAGEELLYDYGDRSKDAVQSHPWLKY